MKKHFDEMEKSLAKNLADRVIQQTIDSDELRERVGDLIDSDELRERVDDLIDSHIVDMACEIFDAFFMKQDDDTEDFLDFLMSDKSIWEVFPGQAVES